MFEFLKNQTYNPLLDDSLSPEEKTKLAYIKPPSGAKQLEEVLKQAQQVLAENNQLPEAYKGPINPSASTMVLNTDGTVTDSNPIPLTDNVMSRINNGESPAQIAYSMNNDPYNGFFIAQANQQQRQMQQNYNPYMYQQPMYNNMYYNNYNPYMQYGYNPYNLYGGNYSYDGLPNIVLSKQDYAEMRQEEEELRRKREEEFNFQCEFRGRMLYAARHYLGYDTTEEECYNIANNIRPKQEEIPNSELEKKVVRHMFTARLIRNGEVIKTIGGDEVTTVGAIEEEKHDNIMTIYRLSRYVPIMFTINYTELIKGLQASPPDMSIEDWCKKRYPEVKNRIDKEERIKCQAKALLNASGNYTDYEKFVRNFTRKFRPYDYRYGYTNIGNASYQPPLTLSDVDVDPNIVNRYRSEADLRRAKFFAQIMGDNNSPYHTSNYFNVS